MPKAAKAKRPGNAEAMLPLRPKRGPKPPSQPATAPWKVICERTRAAQRAIDASIAGVKLPPGPVMVLRRRRAVITPAELETMLDGAADIAKAAYPRKPPRLKTKRRA